MKKNTVPANNISYEQYKSTSEDPFLEVSVIRFENNKDADAYYSDPKKMLAFRPDQKIKSQSAGALRIGSWNRYYWWENTPNSENQKINTLFTLNNETIITIVCKQPCNETAVENFMEGLLTEILK